MHNQFNTSSFTELVAAHVTVRTVELVDHLHLGRLQQGHPHLLWYDANQLHLGLQAAEYSSSKRRLIFGNFDLLLR